MQLEETFNRKNIDFYIENCVTYKVTQFFYILRKFWSCFLSKNVDMPIKSVTNVTKLLNVCYNFINMLDIIEKKDKIYNM